MVNKVDTAIVKLWGETVGAVSWLGEKGYSVFEYDPNFLKLGLDISPIHMSLDEARKGDGLFSFPTLNKETFLGLPGMLADVLPDKFGNRVIDAWLARNGRDVQSFSPVERLCYSGKRSIGALEFEPAVIEKYDESVPVEISELVSLVQNIMHEREMLDVEFGASDSDSEEALYDILRVGTSAGGARPKAVIAMNADGKVLSGQTDAPEGFDYWILKFDGVTDLELGESSGFGRIEYAYHLMAKDAGIVMSECRLLEESGRAHFMTKRFDRQDNQKLHMQSFCGIGHNDFNAAGSYGYEQVFAVMRKLRLSKADAVQQYRRMLFNVISRNQDDHTKNIAFLMGRDGKWKLSPAYDVTYSHNPSGQWTNQHQMTVNGKRDDFSKDDLIVVGDSISLSKPVEIIDEIIEVVENWPKYAKIASVNDKFMADIGKYLRVKIK